MNFPSLDRYDFKIPPVGSPDWGYIVSVDVVEAVNKQLDQAETTEFGNVSSRTAATVTVDLMSKAGRLTHIPYLFSNLSAGGANISMPVAGQLVLVLYISQRTPIAIGAATSWQEYRRQITKGVLPELLPGEILTQSAIRPDPMSHFKEPVNKQDVFETVRGARIYQDYKGRIILQSNHSRNGAGAFVKTVLGNPALTITDDEENDFNVKDETSGEFVAMQTSVSSTEGGDPLFSFTVDDRGNLLLQFEKAWIGKQNGETAEPVTTIEIDTVGKTVVIAGEDIKIGRGASEAMVLGDTLKDILGELIDTLATMKIVVAGASGTIPDTIIQLKATKLKLGTMLSSISKVK